LNLGFAVSIRWFVICHSCADGYWKSENLPMVVSKTPGATEICIQLRPKLMVLMEILGLGSPQAQLHQQGFMERAMGIEPTSEMWGTLRERTPATSPR